MKILISGGGKCNLTHDGPMEEIRAKFREGEARFLKPCFYKFSNKQFLEILHRRGLATYPRSDGRIFPVEPADAKVVVSLLTKYVDDCGVDVKYSSPVSGVVTCGGEIRGIKLDNDVILARSVVLAVGGSSYPATGTTGDGWRWAKDVGHTIVPLRAALAPISIVDAKPEWSGIALRGVVLKARDGNGGKEFARWTGDLLYTHKGVSGPTALGISREVAERLAVPGKPTPFVEADLQPTVAFEPLRERMRAEATQNPKRLASSLLDSRLPARLIPSLLERCGVDGELRNGHLPAKLLTRVVTHLKEWPIGLVATVPLERGEVVAGGVALSEVDPQTMQSRIIRGLYLCGEILDIAGPVGGYNLQAAWSTGHVAGDSAARR